MVNVCVIKKNISMIASLLSPEAATISWGEAKENSCCGKVQKNYYLPNSQ